MNINTKIFLSYVIVFITILVMLFYPKYTFKPEEKKFFCGTSDLYVKEGLNRENLREGRKLFKALCASCHKLNKKLIGPALSNDTLDFNYFLAYTKSRDSLVKAKHKKTVVTIKEYAALAYNHNFSQLNSKQIKKIFDYCNLE